MNLFPLYLFGSLALTVLSLALAVFVVLSKSRQNRNLLERQELKASHQQELLQARLEVQEHSMTLISEELHDNVCQVISLIGSYLAAISERSSEKNIVVLSQSSEKLLQRCLNDIRHISHSLNGELISELGLLSSLENELDHLSNLELNCNLEVHGTPTEFPRETNLLVYRMVQEAIQNVLKHAEASCLTLKALFSDNRATIMIVDDGKGFDSSMLEDSNSLGFRNIYSRARIINADVKVTSELN